MTKYNLLEHLSNWFKKLNLEVYWSNHYLILIFFPLVNFSAKLSIQIIKI